MKTGLTANELDRTERRNTPIPKRSFIREKTDIEVSALPVSIQGNQYLVIFGQGTSPRFHKVSKNKECSCGAPYCEAIEAVHQYLQAGGLRAPDPEGMPFLWIVNGVGLHGLPRNYLDGATCSRA